MATSATTLVRPARAGDPSSISAVQAKAWRMAYGNLLPEATFEALTPEALLPAWRRAVSEPPSPRHAVLVAVADDIVVGFAAVGPSEDRDATEADGQLAVLAVDPLHIRAGHGSRLMSAVVDHLRNHGLNTLSVWIPEGDLARATFFTSAGMLPDGARRSYEGADESTVTEIRLSADIAPVDETPVAAAPVTETPVTEAAETRTEAAPDENAAKREPGVE
jgi:GNAT superfamily N-acetyltransferase